MALTSKLKSSLTGSGEYPWEIIRKAHDLGLTLGGIPEKYGGLGLDLLTICMIGERLAYGCSGITTAMNANELGNHLNTHFVLRFATN